MMMMMMMKPTWLIFGCVHSFVHAHWRTPSDVFLHLFEHRGSDKPSGEETESRVSKRVANFEKSF